MVDGHFFYSQVPSNPAYVPSMASGFAGEQMSFLERTSNFIISYMCAIAKDSFMDQWQEVFTGYDKDFPSLKELTFKNSLVFINSEPLVEFPRPSAARIIDIGGISASSGAKKLNNTWSGIMDLRPHTVLISFGTFAKAHLMLDEYKQSIVEMARRLPNVTFIWKYEIPEHRVTEGVENIVETTWMPQNDILHDPRLSAFVTHGGQGSITESYYAGIPLIVIPVCFDQLRNAAQLRRNGVGIVVEKTDLVTADALEKAIRKICYRASYRANARSLQQVILDRPFPMTEIFVRNMEFLAKHGPLRQFDHHGRHLNVFQYYLIDVLAFVIVIVVNVLFIMLGLLRTCMSCVSGFVGIKLKRE